MEKYGAYKKVMFWYDLAEGDGAGAPSGNANACKPGAQRDKGAGGGCGGAGGIPPEAVVEKADAAREKLEGERAAWLKENEAGRPDLDEYKRHKRKNPDWVEDYNKDHDAWTESMPKGDEEYKQLQKDAQVAEDAIDEAEDARAEKEAEENQEREDANPATQIGEAIGLQGTQFGDLDHITSQQLVDQIGMAGQDYPLLINEIKNITVKELDANTVAQYSPWEGMIWNSHLSDNNPKLAEGLTIDGMFKEMEVAEPGWHPPGTGSKKGYIDHEIGHAIDQTYDIQENKKFDNLWKDFKSKSDADPKYAANNLSDYGATSSKEFLAEAYSEYLNNPNPRPISNSVGAILDSFKGSTTKQGRFGPGGILGS